MAVTISVVETFRDLLGESLRGIVRGDGEYELLFVRDDIDEAYQDGTDWDRIWDEFWTSHLSSSYLEDLFHAGDHRCTVYSFDSASICHLIDGRMELLVSFDRDAGVDLDEVIQIGENLLRLL